MTKFSLIIIGARNGSGLEELVSNQIDNILLIEPVDYNFKSLKERFQKKSNIYF